MRLITHSTSSAWTSNDAGTFAGKKAKKGKKGKGYGTPVAAIPGQELCMGVLEGRPTDTRILIRGDGHYCAPEVLNLLRRLKCNYILGLPKNKRLTHCAQNNVPRWMGWAWLLRIALLVLTCSPAELTV